MMMRIAILLSLAHASLLTQQAKGDHPAVKIIALLQKLQAQVKSEGEEETHLYGKFTYWCGETIKEKTDSVKDYEETMSVASSTIEALTEDIAALDSEMTALSTEIQADGRSKTKMQTERDDENSLYITNKGDLESTITAVDEALTALKDSMPSGFLQTKAVQSPALKKVVGLLLTYFPSNKVVANLAQVSADPIESAEADEFASRQGGDAKYVFKGGDVIEMLKTLKTDFEDELVELNKAEASSYNAHALADQAKQQEIDAATTSREAKTQVKGQKGSDLATAEANLKEATAGRDADQTVLEDTKTTCRQRAEEFDERTKTRAGEVKAMGEAIEALERITGVRAPADKGIETTFSGTDLLQFTRGRKKIADPALAIVNLLRKAGNTKQTAALSKLADKIAELKASKQTPGSGVFDQIKNMISKMIFHLMSEQKDEDDHKHWCDKELNITEKMLTDKSETRAALTASMNQLSAEVDSLSTAIKDNTKSIALMQKSIEEMTAERQEQKTENTATVKDAQDAQTAISQAIAVLEDFYKSTGEVQKEPWELTQVGVRSKRVSVRRVAGDEDVTPEGAGELSEPEPQLWSSKEYTGTDTGSGVIGMLTNIATDFASMEAKARSDETSQQDNYDKEMTATQIDIAEKQSDSQQKEARKGRMEEKLTSKTNDNGHNENELKATYKYLFDLQKACVDGDSTYEDRKAARTLEIGALQDAQKILEDAFEEKSE
jgi:hypothetical protein